MKSWNLHELETPGGSRSPLVLESGDAARAVLIGLEPGHELGDHQVKENAFVLVVDGVAQVEGDGERIDAAAGTLFRFEPDERHAVSTEQGARLLLFLAPWPGPGHYRGEGEAAPAGGRREGSTAPPARP
ncbi:MAG TPA: cupin domain-containing protein [Gaiellaceae bacterium]|nr:cupin domain-containing protein [Gaiellaceae bacterium]